MNKKQKNDNITVGPNFGLWRLLDHARFIIGRAREKELAQFGLTPEQTHVLDILNSAGGTISINEIVNITQRQHHSISTLVSRMSRQGLVQKTKNAQDFRKWDVTITPKGKKCFRQLTRYTINEIFSALTDAEKDELSIHLRKLIEKSFEVLGLEYQESFYREEDGFPEF